MVKYCLSSHTSKESLGQENTILLDVPGPWHSLPFIKVQSPDWQDLKCCSSCGSCVYPNISAALWLPLLSVSWREIDVVSGLHELTSAMSCLEKSWQLVRCQSCHSSDDERRQILRGQLKNELRAVVSGHTHVWLDVQKDVFLIDFFVYHWGLVQIVWPLIACSWVTMSHSVWPLLCLELLHR